MKRILVKFASVLQIVVGALLLVGTVGLTTTAYRTVRDESEQLAENLSAATEALESLRATYEQSATSLFAETGNDAACFFVDHGKRFRKRVEKNAADARIPAGRKS